MGMNATDQLSLNRINNVHRIVELTDKSVADIVEFLHALTDPCVKGRTCLAPWTPDEDETDPSGLLLHAIDNNGDLL